MITRVEIKNYRSIAHADVTMGPLTVLVGRNGAGKSSFVDALKFVRDALQTGLENAVNARGGVNSIRRFGAPQSENVEIAIEVEEGSFKGRYELAFNICGDKVEIQNESGYYELWGAYLDDPPGDKALYKSRFERQGERWVEIPEPRMSGFLKSGESLGNLVLKTNVLALAMLRMFGEFYELDQLLGGDFYTLFPDALRQPQKAVQMDEFGEHGMSFLAALRHILENESTRTDIANALGNVSNGVSDVRVKELGSYLIGELQHEDLEGAPWFDLGRESDGTLRMLGLLAALYQMPDARVLLALEEPETALHPGALAVLADEIKAASYRRQVLITTQSPDLIARFPADDLRVVERRAGLTHIAPLDETQRQVIEDQLFDAGELLRSEGLRGASR